MSIFDPTYKTVEIDTKLKELVLNRLTKDQFDQLSAHSPDEVWFIQDEDLSGQPIVVDTRQGQIPTKLSELQNDVGYLSAVSWSQVTGKPTIPTNTSQLTNDSGFITSAYVQNNALDVWRDWEYADNPPGLKFTANTAGSTIAMQKVGSAPSVSLEYTTDGSTWNDFIVGTTTVTLANVGDNMWMRAKTTNAGFATSNGNRNKFVMTGSISSSGSITYLLYKDGSEDAAIGNYGFWGLFLGCAALTTPPQLTGVTTLGIDCFHHMFYECTSLTTAPELPLTTLAQGCYADMFSGCTSLTEAPELPATEVLRWCYDSMFYGCTSLNKIRIGYTGNFSSYCFNNWVVGVASSGTFYYNGSDTTRGTNAIPNNWSVQTFV